ncbi:MAG TPA: NADH-quinone oxidoreductase subunit NuoH [Thermoflexales bacterium]|nr:NADH-quinone oxidoreductase subunit NuoH [Thermoflexales bacterium]HQZ21173.1 NADH-quinone oxidoreductase subunit NuoH [Thermoflexales bacterium]
MDALNNLLSTVGDAIANLIYSLLGKNPGADFAIAMLAAILICTAAALGFMALTWMERKLVARIQDRVGPNQAGPYGLLQPIADGVKMFTKEDSTPRDADRPVYNLAPLIIAIFALATYAVIPFAPRVVGTNLNIGVFYVVAIGSASTIAILMAGWGSNNKYSLLGAFRTVAQLVGYEVPMLLNILPVVMLTGSMSLIDVINKQTTQNGGAGIPFILMLPLSAVVFIISGIAETGRSPFDLLEAESEIVAGFHVEYSGMKFALFFLGEYVNTLAISLVFVTLFLGGYAGPEILPGYVWLLLKVGVVLAFLMWLRGTLPRVRVDQLMNFNWKFLVPMSLINILAVAFLSKIFVTTAGAQSANGGILVHPIIQTIILGGTGMFILVMGLWLVARRTRALRLAEEQTLAERRAQNMATAASLK